MSITLAELVSWSPIAVVREDLWEGVGYIERLLADPESVQRWHALRGTWSRLAGDPLRRVAPLDEGTLRDIERNGLAEEVAAGRLGVEELVRLLLSPEQLAGLAERRGGRAPSRS